MNQDYTELKTRQSFIWVRSNETGTSYLCPAGLFKDKGEISESDLRTHCIDESLNPHND